MCSFCVKCSRLFEIVLVNSRLSILFFSLFQVDVQFLWVVVGCKSRILFLLCCRLLSVVSVVLKLHYDLSYFRLIQSRNSFAF